MWNRREHIPCVSLTRQYIKIQKILRIKCVLKEINKNDTIGPKPINILKEKIEFTKE